MIVSMLLRSRGWCVSIRSFYAPLSIEAPRLKRI
jgi:hypothetical protein